MEIEFAHSDLDRLETDAAYTYRQPIPVVKQYRRLIGLIRVAVDERDFRGWPGRRFEKLQGDRSHQHSMRLNDQYRLTFELKGEAPNKVVRVIDIEDYH